MSSRIRATPATRSTGGWGPGEVGEGRRASADEVGQADRRQGVDREDRRRVVDRDGPPLRQPLRPECGDAGERTRQFLSSEGQPRFALTETMLMPSTEDRRLVALTKSAVALPEASRELAGDHAGFKVRKKTFGYFLNNHHGDGIVAVCFKMAPGDNARLVALDPSRFYSACVYRPEGMGRPAAGCRQGRLG